MNLIKCSQFRDEAGARWSLLLCAVTRWHRSHPLAAVTPFFSVQQSPVTSSYYILGVRWLENNSGNQIKNGNPMRGKESAAASRLLSGTALGNLRLLARSYTDRYSSRLKSRPRLHLRDAACSHRYLRLLIAHTLACRQTSSPVTPRSLRAPAQPISRPRSTVSFETS